MAKEKVCCAYHLTPFKRIPKITANALIQDEVYWINELLTKNRI